MNKTFPDKEIVQELHQAEEKLRSWISENSWEGWDPFTGLSSPFAKYLTLNNKYLRIFFQQFFKRFPINLRAFFRIRKEVIPKTMGVLSSAYLLLYRCFKDKGYLNKTKFFLEWLIKNAYTEYSGYCWGLNSDYQSRGVYNKKGIPDIVTTYYNANAFLDAYELMKNPRYLEIAKSSCDFILKDLGFIKNGDTLCIGYYPCKKSQVHNANMFGVALLSRAYYNIGEKYLLEIANKAVKYTMKYQRYNGSWFYSEAPKYGWVDNFHTGYILESLYYYINYTRNFEFMPNLLKGLEFYKVNLFLPDGTPKYYHNKTYPIDIQCSAQAIQTFAVLNSIDKKYLDMAKKVAKWTVENMQDESGYFYYRKYRFYINKTPYMRWGESTMLLALAHMMKAITSASLNKENECNLFSLLAQD